MALFNFIFSIISNFIILYYYKKKDYYLLLLFPLFAFAGRWLATIFHYSDNIIYSYIELLFSILVIVKYNHIKGSYILFLFPLSSFISLININNQSALLNHLFFSLLLFSSIGYYSLFINKMKNIIDENIIDKIVIIWLILGIYYRISTSFIYDLNFIESRSGSSLWASNHISMVILLFLPLISSKKLFNISLIFLVLQFSRGVYGAIIVMFALSIFINNSKRILVNWSKSFLIVSILFLSIIFIFPNTFNNIYKDFKEKITQSDISSRSQSNNILSYSNIIKNIENDERVKIHETAWIIIKNSNYLGVGIGNFVYGLEKVGYINRYSNAHNLYLTLLSEGGLIYLCLFITIIMRLIKFSYKFDKRVLVSILGFLFYGLFSGQIYEATTFRSAIDYYYLIFLLAYIENKRRTNPYHNI